MSPVLRKQLENILFYGFVDERICKPKKLIQIYIPQPDEEDFYSSVGRAPIEIHLRSGTITQKEFFEEIEKRLFKKFKDSGAIGINFNKKRASIYY